MSIVQSQPSQTVEKFEVFQKDITIGCFPVFERRGQDVQKDPSSKAASTLAGGAYEGVREHDKVLRTPLADFFNTLLMVSGR